MGVTRRAATAPGGASATTRRACASASPVTSATAASTRPSSAKHLEVGSPPKTSATGHRQGRFARPCSRGRVRAVITRDEKYGGEEQTEGYDAARSKQQTQNKKRKKRSNPAPPFGIWGKEK